MQEMHLSLLLKFVSPRVNFTWTIYEAIELLHFRFIKIQGPDLIFSF